MDAPQRLLQEGEYADRSKSKERTLEDPKTLRVTKTQSNLTWRICLTDSFSDEIKMGADR